MPNWTCRYVQVKMDERWVYVPKKFLFNFIFEYTPKKKKKFSICQGAVLPTFELIIYVSYVNTASNSCFFLCFFSFNVTHFLVHIMLDFVRTFLLLQFLKPMTPSKEKRIFGNEIIFYNFRSLSCIIPTPPFKSFLHLNIFFFHLNVSLFLIRSP